MSRERSYHGVNYGGTSLGGLPGNQKGFGPFVPGTEHRLPLPYDAKTDRFTPGEPEGGAGYAGALETICAEVGGDTIAAVIVEPMTGSAAYTPLRRIICRACGRSAAGTAYCWSSMKSLPVLGGWVTVLPPSAMASRPT